MSAYAADMSVCAAACFKRAIIAVDGTFMPLEQINISLSPQMVRFIRDKVNGGQYADASDLVRDAVRRLQADEAARTEWALLAGFEAGLPESSREAIRLGVQLGIADIESGRFEEFDAEGLRGLGKQLVAGTIKKRAARRKAG